MIVASSQQMALKLPQTPKQAMTKKSLHLFVGIYVCLLLSLHEERGERVRLNNFLRGTK